MMGLWITLVIVLFVLGSVMALKPNGVDIRLDKVRMTAKQLSLHPQLLACPEWLRGESGEFGKGMIAKYAVVIDNMTLPHARYQVVKDKGVPQLRPLSMTQDKSVVNPTPTDFSLDKQEVELPTSIQPLVKALEIRANSISIYWDDVAYVHAKSNPNYHENNIQPDLSAMKDKLTEWAMLVQKARQGL